MLCKALKSFAGVVNMKKGETKDINDPEYVSKLVDSGLVEKLDDNKPVKATKTANKAKTNKEEV